MIEWRLGSKGCSRCAGFVITEHDETFCLNCGKSYGPEPLPFVRKDKLEVDENSYAVPRPVRRYQA